MKRRLFTILSACSLLLFVAVVALWVRPVSTIRFILPDGFSGPFIVIEDRVRPSRV